MARIDIIVPIYKAEAYLDRCVQSVLNQTYRDFRLVLVDDGSPDLSGALCDAYATKDSRVHVIHKQNAGSAAARNTGLDWVFANSDSQWICFVDSDDWIHPRMLERLLAASEEFGGTISVCGYHETGKEGPWSESVQQEPALWETSKFYQERYINATVPWAKLFPRECLEKERFTPGKYIDDEYLMYRLLFQKTHLAVLDDAMYGYFVNPEGAMRRRWNKGFLDAWEAFEQQLKYFEGHGYPELVKFRIREYLENALVNLEGAKSVEDEASVRFIEKRIRNLIRRCWHQKVIHFQYDYDILERFYPVLTKTYRFYLEKIKK